MPKPSSSPRPVPALHTVAGIRAYVEEMRSNIRNVGAFVQRARERRLSQAVPPATAELLDTSLEELRVAEEELRAQVEELVFARSALEAEHHRYLDLFENAPDAYIVTDRRGAIREANAAAAALLNVTSDFLQRRLLLHFVARGDTEAFRAFVGSLHAVAATDPARIDLRLRPRNGPRVFGAELRARVLRGLGDATVAVRWIIRPASRAAPLEDAASEPGIAGALPMTKSRVVMAEILQDAVEMLRPAAARKAVSLRVSADGCELDADALRLHQVVANLLSNALKFTPGGGTIEATAHREDTTVHLAIRDTGPGIEPAMHEAIFLPFRQADAGAREPGGMGLGLFIVRSIVEQHGGRVWVDSRAAETGSTFHVVLPVRASVCGARAPTRS